MDNTNKRLPPDGFRALIKARGWRLADTARRWGITDTHLSRLIADRERPSYWDDAARGLPRITRAVAAELRRARLASSKPRKRKVLKLGPGYSYHGALIPGAVVIVVKELGEMATEGDEGVVVEVRDDGTAESYLIRFARGEDWFTVEYVEEYLVDVGRVEPERLL